jgi:ABC-type Mn2+/Zn2+ transport system ATPase subunit
VTATGLSRLIEARNVSAGYGRRIVLHGVSLAVHQGEFWFLLGPNGQGKSTLLRAILGLIGTQKGLLLLAPALRDRSGIGFVPQRCDLNPSLPTTVREFVLSGLVGIRATTAERERRLVWALDRVGLAGLPRQDYWQLSGGQRQRALVARALARQPSLLITNGLDLSTEESLLESLANLNTSQGLTILFVTHDLNLACRFASHVALFHGGEVTAGPVASVLTPSALAATYDLSSEVANQVLALGGVRGATAGVGG